MNIAVIGFRGIPDVQGGIEKHCQELYPRIAGINGRVTVVGRKGYVRPCPYDYKSTRVIPIWFPRSKSLETMIHTGLCCVWLLTNFRRFDMVHIHAIGPSLYTPVLRLLGFKVIVTNHGPEYNRQKWGMLAKHVLKISEYIGSKTADKIIAVSPQIQEDLKKNCGVDAYYIPNGVNRPDIIPSGETLLRFGLNTKRYILCVGRQVPEKGFHDLIAAFRKVPTDWKLVMVGSADHEDHYSRSLKVKASGSKKIVMTGFQKGKALGELYSNAGLFILPSYHEGHPIVALEAMSYDLPILLSDIPANMEIASAGELFPVGDVDALKEKIARFIQNPPNYFDSKINETRRRRLIEEFDWDLIAQKTVEVYESLEPQPRRQFH